MPLNIRSIAVNIATMCFFAAGLIGWCSGLTPLTCCKRALAAAIIMYIAAIIVVKVINAILINAIVKSQMNKLREKADEYRN